MFIFDISLFFYSWKNNKINEILIKNGKKIKRRREKNYILSFFIDNIYNYPKENHI